jgi:hypothetical protein
MTPEENLARITEEVNEQMRRFGYILPETSQRLLEAQTGIQNFGFKVQMATSVMGNLADAVGDYTKAMYRGEQGAAVFNNSMSKMTDAVSTLAVGLSLLMPGGPVVKAVTAGLTALGVYALKTAEDLAATSKEQADTMYSAFSQLAESGAVGADGIEGLFNDIQKLGLNVTQLDKYLSMAGQNADAMAMMGGTVLKGRQQFAELGRSMAGYNESFRKLGLDQDAQAEAILEYAKMQAKISRGTITDFSQLGKSAYELILQQDALTKVTGLSRKQQQQALQEAQRNEKFLAAENKIRRQFGEGSDTMKQLGMLTTLTKDLGEDVFKGMQDMMSGGAPTPESKALLSLAPEMFQLIQQLKSGKFQGDQQGFEKGFDQVLKGMARSSRSQEELAMFGKSVGGMYSSLTKAETMLNRGGLQENLAAARENQAAQIGDKTGQVGKQAELRAAQNEVMLASQAFIQTGLPGILRDASMVVQKDILDLMKKIGETLGEGVVVGRQSSRFGPRSVGVMDNLPENASQRLDRRFIRTNPDGSESRTGPVGPNNPRVDNRQLPPWSEQNPLPVVIQPPVPPIVIPDQTPPPPRRPGMNDPLFPPPRNQRAHGTSGEIGSLFEPKDIIAQLHKGERVLNKDENTDLTKLFNMVSGEKSQKKMMDAQGEMLKVIDSITNGMKLMSKSGGNKDFSAAYADMSSDMPSTDTVQKTMIDLQGQMLQKMENFAMPTSADSQAALLGDMPKLDINKETVEQLGQNIKDSMGEEFKSAVSGINRLAEQMQSQGNAGLQQQMVGLLEEMRRSMQVTAKASGRLAQVASN